MPQALKDILRGMAQEHPGIQKILLQGEIERIWPQLAQDGKPQELKNGRLFIEVSSPVWANELRFAKKGLIEDLNRALGQEAVKEIVFCLPKSEEKEPKQRTVISECKECGIEISSRRPLCSVCSEKSKTKKRDRLRQLIKARPWADFRRAKDELPEITPEEMEKERKYFERKLLDEINLIIREMEKRKSEKLRKELRIQALSLAALKTQLHPSQIDNAILKRWISEKASKLI